MNYPAMITQVGHVEPCPARIRAVLAGATVLDTTRALYVWESIIDPVYYIPLSDVRRDLLIPEGQAQPGKLGTGALHSLQAGDTRRLHAARLMTQSPVAGLSGTVRFEWDALDAWFAEDEQVFSNPRSPYVRVDALRSTRTVRIELNGTVLAESASPVMVFETGHPTRYYFNRTDVNFPHLTPSNTVTACPYKGVTSSYWSASVGGKVCEDVAWVYDFPLRELLPITGLVAFYNEKTDIFLDGHRLAS